MRRRGREEEHNTEDHVTEGLLVDNEADCYKNTISGTLVT